MTSAVSVSSITVSGLPFGSESSALFWHKIGAVDLQVTDTFPLGTSTSATTTSSGSTTFVFPVPLHLAAGTQSLVFMVDDRSSGTNWSVRQLDNVGQSLTVGGIGFESVWGWQGDVNTGTNTASSVSIYDPSFFQIPRVVLTLAP